MPLACLEHKQKHQNYYADSLTQLPLIMTKEQ